MGRVLVVDDDPSVLRLMALALRDAGYFVATAASVAEARQVTGPFEMLVLDVRLPNGDAPEVRALFPGTPTLTVSGHREADLHKPFSMRELVAAVAARIALPG